MYSGDENRRKRKYPKNCASKAQNEQINSKNGCLHYFFSPILFLTLLDVSSQRGSLLLVVFCHHPLDDRSLSSWWCDDFTDFGILRVEVWISNKNAFRRFPSTMGKPSFLLLLTLYAICFHSNTASLLEYTKDDYWEKESLKKSQIWWRNHCDGWR
jgi:hypothetical protein